MAIIHFKFYCTLLFICLNKWKLEVGLPCFAVYYETSLWTWSKIASKTTWIHFLLEEIAIEIGVPTSFLLWAQIESIGPLLCMDSLYLSTHFICIHIICITVKPKYRRNNILDSLCSGMFMSWTLSCVSVWSCTFLYVD